MRISQYPLHNVLGHAAGQSPLQALLHGDVFKDQNQAVTLLVRIQEGDKIDIYVYCSPFAKTSSTS